MPRTELRLASVAILVAFHLPDGCRRDEVRLPASSANAHVSSEFGIRHIKAGTRIGNRRSAWGAGGGASMRRNLLASITMLSSAVAFAVLMGSPAAAQTGWKMAPALPKPLGEIMGAVVGNHWYVLAGLDSETRRPFGVVYDFDNASARWTEKRSVDDRRISADAQ